MLIYPFCEFGEKLREKVVQTSEMVNSIKKYKNRSERRFSDRFFIK